MNCISKACARPANCGYRRQTPGACQRCGHRAQESTVSGHRCGCWHTRLLRRLGLDTAAKFLAKTFNFKLTSQIIAWEDVASIEHDDPPLRLKVSQERLVQMEPVDIAAILDDLDHHTSKALLQGFDDEILADTLEQSSFEVQQAILAAMDPNAPRMCSKKWTPTKPLIFGRTRRRTQRTTAQPDGRRRRD